MNLGLPEIIIIIVIIVVLFGIVRVVGDKRYLKRSGGTRGSAKDKGNEEKV